jgi:signal peptidase II
MTTTLSAQPSARRASLRGRALLVLPLLGLIVGLDQLTKHWAEVYVRPRGIVTVIPELMDLRYARNAGAFFSLGADLAAPLRRGLLSTASVLMLLLSGALYLRADAASSRLRWALSLLAAGAVGNLIDRVRSGEVVDFVHLHVGPLLHWATFNLADAAITAGLLLLAWDLLRPQAKGA